MSKMPPTLIVILVLVIGIAGIYFLSKYKPQNTFKTLPVQISETPTPIQSQPTPQSVIISPADQPASKAAVMNIIKQPNGLIIEDEIVGTGAQAKSGNTVTVNYLGMLENGKKFDSSYDRNQPFTTQIGVGQVIQGWDEGIVGMKVGGKRKLTIPSSLGYGAQDMGTIPPNSTLIFEVELLSAK